MTVDLEVLYTVGGTRQIHIPSITDWNQVKEWWVKWDVLHYTLDGDNFVEVNLNTNTEIDQHHPTIATVREAGTVNVLDSWE